MRVAVTFCQLLANHRPVKVVAVIAQPRDAHVLRQRNIGNAIADDIAVSLIQHILRQIALDQLHLWLTAVALVGWHVRANQHFIEHHALRGQHLHHQIMRAVKVCLREAVGTQTVLVGDHHQLVPGFLQLEQHRDHVRFKRQLVESVDLKISWWLRNKGAVTIDEKDLLGHTFSAFRASITRWLSARVCATRSRIALIP